MAKQFVKKGNLKGPKGDPGGPFNPTAINAGDDLNNLRTTGWYYCRLTATAATILNRPPGIGDGPFMVEVRATPFNYVSQHLVGYSGQAAGVYARNTGNAAGSVFTQWARLDNQVSTGSNGEGGGLANALRVMDFTERRGIRSTLGKGAVALRFDHGLTNFKSSILPLLRTNGLPSSLAINSRTWTAAENSGASKADVLSWVASDRVEVWNHGATHIDATDITSLTDEIVTGLAELRAQLPGVTIDGFAVPGVGGTNYGGFNGGATPESFYTTTAGQLILEHHAVSTGAFPGTAQRTLDGTIRQGQAHYSIEAQSVAQIKAQIDSAISNKTGLQLMMHPSNLNTPGYLTTAQLSEVLAYIKSRVEAGTLVALSPYELTLADATVAVGEPGPAGAGVPVGGTAKQVVRKTADNTTTEWGTLAKADVGLSAVDNTADADKPVSAATAAELAAKVPLLGTRGVTKTIYVRADGSDDNDGSSATQAFREVRTAVSSLAAHGPVLRGSIVIDVGAGTYKGGVRVPLTRGKSQDDFIRIVGPAVGHPNAPTAVIDHAADAAATSGIMVEDGTALWLQNIKTIGAFPIHIDARRNCYVWLTNVHSDGQKVGSVGGGVGWAINSHCRYYVAGGLIQNMVSNGVQELFGVVRSYNNVSSNAEQLTIRNCEVGIQAKENCSGHLDYLNVEDCLTGVEMNGNCVANVKAISLKRNALGYANINSEVHNETGIVWGTGADANTREFISFGTASTELYAAGWVDSATVRTTNVGHASLQTVAANYSTVTLVGPTTEANFASFPTILRGHRMNTAGRRFRVVVRGVVNTTLIGNYRLILRAAGTLLTDATIVAGTAAGSRFEAEFTVVTSADTASGVNSQICFSKLTGEGVASDFTDPARTVDLYSSDRTISVGGLALNAADSVSLKLCEVWA